MPNCAHELEDKHSGSERIVSRPKSARQAWPDWLTNMLALISNLVKIGGATLAAKTHPLEIPVSHSFAVNIDQSLCDTCQLEEFAIVTKAKTVRL